MSLPGGLRKLLRHIPPGIATQKENKKSCTKLLHSPAVKVKNTSLFRYRKREKESTSEWRVNNANCLPLSARVIKPVFLSPVRRMRGILWIAAHPEMSLMVMVMGATLILPVNSGKYKFYNKNSDTEVRTSNNLHNLSSHQSQHRVDK
jgi:hypothetical protein